MSHWRSLPSYLRTERWPTPSPVHRVTRFFGVALRFITSTLLLTHCLVASAADPPIVALAFAPDGAKLIAGSKAGVAIYQWPELKHLSELATVVDDVHDLAFSPDGQFLAVAGGEPADAGLCEILDWPSGTSLCRISGHDDVIYSVDWSADSKKIATASMDSTVIVSSLQSVLDSEALGGESASDSRRLKVLSQVTATGHSKGVLAVGFLAGKASLLSAGLDQSIRLFALDGAGTRLTRTLENHTAAVRGLARRPTPPESLSVVASIGDDRTVRFWQPTIGRMMRFTKFDQAVPLCACWLRDGTQLAVACDDGHVRLIEPDTCEVTADIHAQSGWCYALAVHPQTNQLAVGGAHGIGKVAFVP